MRAVRILPLREKKVQAVVARKQEACILRPQMEAGGLAGIWVRNSQDEVCLEDRAPLLSLRALHRQEEGPLSESDSRELRNLRRTSPRRRRRRDVSALQDQVREVQRQGEGHDSLRARVQQALSCDHGE